MDNWRYCFYNGEITMKNSIGLYKDILCAYLWLNIWVKKHYIISKSIKLPRFRKGVYIYWKSLDQSIIDDKGSVNWSKLSQQKTAVKFEVEMVIHKEYFSDEIAKITPIKSEFQFVILYIDENERLKRSVRELSYGQILGANKSNKDIVSDIVLPNKTGYGIKIDWESNSPYLNKTGKVYRNNKIEKAVISANLYGEKYSYRKNYEFTIRRKNYGRKMLVMVPHGDDEIFLAYNVIRKAVLSDYEVYICFFCNVDTKGNKYAEQRHKESIKACGYLGVPSENIVILGYSTKWKYSHIYNNHVGIMESAQGKTCTYGTKYITDWHTLRYGHPALYKRENIISDIEDIINTIHPEIIFVNDFDKHLDHIAYSLLFDEAMGKILNKDNNYRPVVYKGFCYATSAYSKPSLFNIVCRNTPKPGKNKKYYLIYADTELENPSYLWKDRVRFKTQKEFMNKNINLNPAAYAIKLYNRMYRNIPCFIHGDEVFWKRRTDSISYIANISVTSGVSEYLNDFKLADVKRLNHLPYKFNCSEWIPDENDKEKRIIFSWKEEHLIKYIRFYRNPTENYVKEIIISCNGWNKRYSLFKSKNVTYKDIYFECRTSVLEIKILNGSNKRSGFSEIEIYEKS